MISIIIPVYNAERHLRQCLQSVLNQKYTNWECILIDDGSKDSSGKICDDYCQKDSRFRVIHQQNNGVSASRNNALKEAEGCWITFVDSDDWLDSDYLEKMVDNNQNADLVVSGQRREFADGHVVLYNAPKTELFSIEAENAEKFNTLNENFLLYAPHEKLFLTDIIRDNQLQFDESCSYGEDLQFVYQYLKHVVTISTVNEALYHYRMGDGKTLSTKLRNDQFSEDYLQWQIVYNFYKLRLLLTERTKEYLARRLWGIVYDGLFLYPQIKNVDKKYIDDILSIPEITFLKKYQHVFPCAKWIRKCIVNRCSLVFKLYFLSK